MAKSKKQKIDAIQFQPAKVYLLYARVSPKGSTWNAEETSIAVQLQQCRDYVLKRDPSATFIEIYDELKSGKNLDRSGVQKVIADLRSGRCSWDCLVVWHLDRLTRSLADALPLFKMIRDADKGFMSVRQELDMFTAGGRFMMHIFIATAEYEREMTSERVSAKMHSIAAAGKIPWGNIPYGYRRKAGVKNTLEIDPDAAQIVQDLFRMYLSGNMTFSAVRQKYGDLFPYRTKIYKMLRNRMYVGEFEYDGEIYKGEHEPIIDRETFDKVQIMLPEKGGYHQPRAGAQKYKYLLSGMVICKCGNRMSSYSASSRGNKFFYYKCTDPSCKNSVSAPALDKKVLEQIKATVKNEDLMKKIYQEYIEDVARERLSATEHIQEIDREIADAKKREKNIAEVFTSGRVTDANMKYWNDLLTEATSFRSSLELRRSEFQEELPTIPPDSFFDQMTEELLTWSSSLDREEDYALKRTLIGALVQDVECTTKNNFRIKLVMSKCLKWWAMRDSNPRHSRCKRDALTN